MRIKSLLKYICFASIFTIVILGCKDDDQNENPNMAPLVTIISPLNNAAYNSGEAIPLSLRITQDAEIVNYRVLIRDLSRDELVFVKSEFTSAREIVLDTTIFLEVDESTEMGIEVRTEDSFGNQVDETASTFILNPPLGNKFTLNFNLEYDNEILRMNNAYTYPSGEQFELSRFDMYISNLTLINGNEEQLLEDFDYLKMTETYEDPALAAEGYNYSVAGLEDGNYDAIRFNIGLTPEINSTSPSDYPVNHPLGASSDYWPTWDSYIFTSMEGRMDLDTSNPDFEHGFALHLGSNEAMKIIELQENTTLANNEETIVEIRIDLRDVFIDQDGKIYNIQATPTTHSLTQLPEVRELAENLKNSINR